MTKQVPALVAFAPNKKLIVRINDNAAEIALVDVALVTDRVVGARALWKPETFRELFVTFADPEVIGMSAIARYFHASGKTVAGYDKTPTPLTDELISEGIDIHFDDDFAFVFILIEIVEFLLIDL